MGEERYNIDMANGNNPLVEYDVLRDEVNCLIQAYNKLVENNKCACGFQLFDEGHKKGCVKHRVIKKAVYRKVAITLHDLVLAERALNNLSGKL